MLNPESPRAQLMGRGKGVPGGRQVRSILGAADSDGACGRLQPKVCNSPTFLNAPSFSRWSQTPMLLVLSSRGSLSQSWDPLEPTRNRAGGLHLDRQHPGHAHYHLPTAYLLGPSRSAVARPSGPAPSSPPRSQSWARGTTASPGLASRAPGEPQRLAAAPRLRAGLGAEPPPLPPSTLPPAPRPAPGQAPRQQRIWRGYAQTQRLPGGWASQRLQFGALSRLFGGSVVNCAGRQPAGRPRQPLHLSQLPEQ